MSTYTYGKFGWFEAMVPDVDKAMTFYGGLFGWTWSPFGDAYHVALNGESGVAGVMATPAPGIPPHWISSVSVADVDASTAKVKALGGAELKAPFDIPTVGRMSVVADPDGAPFELFAPEGDPPAGDDGSAGAFCWNELNADDLDGAKRFYAELLGWSLETQKMPQGDYVVASTEAGMEAGMFKKPVPQMPACWLPYVRVDDVEATIGSAKELGGTCQFGPHAVPGVGQIAWLADDQGASFAVLQPAGA